MQLTAEYNYVLRAYNKHNCIKLASTSRRYSLLYSCRDEIDIWYTEDYCGQHQDTCEYQL